MKCLLLLLSLVATTLSVPYLGSNYHLQDDVAVMHGALEDSSANGPYVHLWKLPHQSVDSSWWWKMNNQHAGYAPAANWAGPSQWQSGQWQPGQWHPSQWHPSQWQSGQWYPSQWQSGQWQPKQWQPKQWQLSQWQPSQWQPSQWQPDQCQPDQCQWWHSSQGHHYPCCNSPIHSMSTAHSQFSIGHGLGESGSHWPYGGQHGHVGIPVIAF